ncbi:MAG: DUF255 domain-containing protein [bacterium]
MNFFRQLVLSILFAFLAAGLVFADGETKKNESDSTQKAEVKNTEIAWISYDEGLVKAKKEGKHVFIDFTTSWCGWCKKMDKETFSRPEVIELVNEHFVPVQVDGDSQNMLDIDGFKITEQSLTKSEFGVRGYPTFWFLKSDGTKLGNISGYRDTKSMMDALTYVKDEKYDTTKTSAPSTGK